MENNINGSRRLQNRSGEVKKTSPSEGKIINLISLDMLNYLFYRVYKFQNKIVGEGKNTAAFSAILSIGLLLGLNLFTVLIAIDKSMNLFAWLESSMGNFQIIPPLIILWLIALILYFKYCHKSKYKVKITNIKTTKKNIYIINNIIVILYQVLTFILFLYVLKYRFS